MVCWCKITHSHEFLASAASHTETPLTRLLHEPELIRCVTAFVLADSSHNLQLERSELGVFTTRIGLRLTPIDIEDLFLQIDVDGNGRIDFLELLGWLTAPDDGDAMRGAAGAPAMVSAPAWPGAPASESNILRVVEVPMKHTMYLRPSSRSSDGSLHLSTTDYFDGIPGIHIPKLPIVQPAQFGSRPQTADFASKMPAVHAGLLAKRQLYYDARPNTAPQTLAGGGGGGTVGGGSRLGIARPRTRPTKPSVLELIYRGDNDSSPRAQEPFVPQSLALSDFWDKLDQKDNERSDLIEMAMKRIYDKVGHDPKRAMEVFREIDEDQSGSLDFDEFQAALAEMGILLNEEQIRWVMQYLDTDGDGDVSTVEFMSKICSDKGTLSAMADGVLEKVFTHLKGDKGVAIAAFEKVDKDDGVEEGFLNYGQFEDALVAMELGLTHAQIQCMIDVLDQDGDGRISTQEFITSVFSGRHMVDLENQSVQVRKISTPWQQEHL
eukprot:SAG31_NODE_727_length_12536_cov_2.306022_5_plen_494_part_00